MSDDISAWNALKGKLPWQSDGDHRNEDADLNKFKAWFCERIWNTMREYGETEPPLLEDYTSKFIRHNRKTRVSETDAIEYGRLIVDEDRFTIQLSTDLTYTQKRSELGHELGHTYQYDTTGYPIEPIYDRELTSTKDPQGLDEGFAWEVAGHLLVPRPLIVRKLPENASLYSFFKAANRFEVTRTLLARRLYWDTHHWESDDNYWLSSILVFYPKSKYTRDELPPPEGNKEVHRGHDLRNLDLKRVWPDLQEAIRFTMDQPKALIDPTTMAKEVSAVPFSFNDQSLTVETMYRPSHKRIYLLIVPKHHVERRATVTLARFS